RIRQAPSVGVKHRNDWQDAIVLGQRKHRARAYRQRVQKRRTVRVNDSLGIASGAAGVAHRCRGAFVDLRPIKSRLFVFKQLLITKSSRSEGSGIAVADYDVVLDGLQLVNDL